VEANHSETMNQANQATKLNCLPLPFTCGLLRVGIFAAETKSTPGTHVIGFHDILIQNNAGVEELHLKIRSSKRTSQQWKPNSLYRKNMLYI
jgi:hypothetical protein